MGRWHSDRARGVVSHHRVIRSGECGFVEGKKCVKVNDSITCGVSWQLRDARIMNSRVRTLMRQADTFQPEWM